MSLGFRDSCSGCGGRNYPSASVFCDECLARMGEAEARGFCPDEGLPLATCPCSRCALRRKRAST